MPEAGSPQGYVLGFDFGKRRIGVAVGQSATRSASAVVTIAHKGVPDWAAIAKLVAEWRPVLLLVGLPLNAEGSETNMSRAARAFGAELEKRHQLPIEFADERHSSQAAEARFAQLRAEGSMKRKHASKLDAMAAQIILENWLQSLP